MFFKNEKGLSAADFKQKMNELKNFRYQTSKDLPMFKDIRQVFSEICDKHATQRYFNSSLRSTGNRVHFKNDLVSNTNMQNKSKIIMSQPLKNSQKSNASRTFNERYEFDLKFLKN